VSMVVIGGRLDSMVLESLRLEKTSKIRGCINKYKLAAFPPGRGRGMVGRTIPRNQLW